MVFIPNPSFSPSLLSSWLLSEHQSLCQAATRRSNEDGPTQHQSKGTSDSSGGLQQEFNLCFADSFQGHPTKVLEPFCSAVSPAKPIQPMEAPGWFIRIDFIWLRDGYFQSLNTVWKRARAIQSVLYRKADTRANGYLKQLCRLVGNIWLKGNRYKITSQKVRNQ